MDHQQQQSQQPDHIQQDEVNSATEEAAMSNQSTEDYAQGNAPSPDTATAGGTDEVSSSILDCPVCLQPSVHPVELPCGHIFCFLCIKGVATQGGQQARCAICRSHIPKYVLTNPRLKDISQLYKDDKTCSDFKWFYEARSGGWWEYEERTMQELEKSFESKQSSCQLLIAGHMYDIDFAQMIQFRVGNRNLFRRIKRDTSTADKRGIAGIRLVQGAPPPQTPEQPAARGRRRGLRSPRGAGRANAATATSNAVPTSTTPQNDIGANPITSPVSSQQSYDDSDEDDSDVLIDSDDEDEDEDENEDMALGEEEEESETDDYNVDEEELRDGARAPTSRSDRSTSSFTNQTPPPLPLSTSTTGAIYSNRGRNRSTPPTTASTPNSHSSTSNSDNVNHSPSPVSPTLRASPNVLSPQPSIVTSTSANANPSNMSTTSIQIGPGLRITVDYTNPTGEEEIL